MRNQVILILFILDTFFDGEGIAINIQNLQIFETCLFVSNSTKVTDNLLKGRYLIVSYWKHVEFYAVLKATQHLNVIVIDW